MAHIQYIEKKFNSKTLILIDQANEIIEEYQQQGFDLTLRQLYYQFVSRDLLQNTSKEYDKLGRAINDARLAGLVDWESIVDRTRLLARNAHWDSPKSIIQTCAEQYQIDKWEGQKYKVEVWVEKEALVGVIDRVCRETDTPYFACRGYVSQSSMWKAAMRIEGYFCEDQWPIILHLGDHDPSGIEMTRDIQDRLSLFVPQTNIEVIRIALNMDQIIQYGPPPNPAKLTDTRSSDYITKYGFNSWELDALEPSVIVELIKDNILQYRDERMYDERVCQEIDERKQLREVAETV